MILFAVSLENMHCTVFASQLAVPALVTLQPLFKAPDFTLSFYPLIPIYCLFPLMIAKGLGNLEKESWSQFIH